MKDEEEGLPFLGLQACDRFLCWAVYQAYLGAATCSAVVKSVVRATDLLVLVIVYLYGYMKRSRPLSAYRKSDHLRHFLPLAPLAHHDSPVNVDHQRNLKFVIFSTRLFTKEVETTDKSSK